MRNTEEENNSHWSRLFPQYAFITDSREGIRGDSLYEYARFMRNNPTEAEKRLWDLLRKKQLKVKFRRQHVIGNYIVDFINLNSGLIIEVDGGYHHDTKQSNYDTERTTFLNSLGYRVLRFTNSQVLSHPEVVIDQIKFHL